MGGCLIRAVPTASLEALCEDVSHHKNFSNFLRDCTDNRGVILASIAQWRGQIDYYRAAAAVYLLLAFTRPPDSKAMITSWTASRTVRSESA